VLRANIAKASLKKLCKTSGVKIQEVYGQLAVEEGPIMDFLGVLDRRLYQVELVRDLLESFRAANHSKINNS